MRKTVLSAALVLAVLIVVSTAVPWCKVPPLANKRNWRFPRIKGPLLGGPPNRGPPRPSHGLHHGGPPPPHPPPPQDDDPVVSVEEQSIEDNETENSHEEQKQQQREPQWKRPTWHRPGAFPPKPKVDQFKFSPFNDWKSPPVHKPGRPLVTFYEHEDHNGVKYETDVGQRCYNLPNVMNDKASSINTHGRCVLVCMDRDCKRCKKMKPGTPGHYKLREIQMDDVITSLKPCGDIYEVRA